MPHCQKENHNHAAKSKEERRLAKIALIARKKQLKEAQLAAEAEAALRAGNATNIIAPVEGFGEYEVGYEPEEEYKRFNVKKRSKKHLRNDLRRAKEREEREEEERRKREEEEEFERRKKEERVEKRRMQKINDENDDEGSSEEEEEEPIILEYFVFVCECCDKRYATKNQFRNHSNSKKHRSNVRIYEELGLLVTHVELRGENGNEKEAYDDDEEDNEEWDMANDCRQDGVGNRNGGTNDAGSGNELGDEEEESEEESDYEEYIPPTRNIFAGFDSDSSSEEDDSSDGDDDGDEDGDEKMPPARLKNPPPQKSKNNNNNKNSNDTTDEDDKIDFDELIHQNRLLQKEIDAKDQNTTTVAIPPTPLPFHETYDPDNYDVNENRLASVQHRLRRNLAQKGIAPSSSQQPTTTTTPSSSPDYDPLDAIAMGRTLLQEVLDANISTLQQKLDAYRQHKKHCALMVQQHALHKGNTKSLPAQYTRKVDAADNAAKRAIVHHAGSHYHMQAARTMQFGRQKGLMARHSSQGSRLQASRMAAKEMANMQGGGGMKIGKKTSKKSIQKRNGEAGGSKKSGGKKGDGD